MRAAPQRASRLADDGFGALIGGIAGGLIGSLFGDGGGRVLASAAGTVAGLFVGAATQDVLQDGGREVSLRMSDGRMQRVRAPADTAMAPGAEVTLLLREDGSLSIVPD